MELCIAVQTGKIASYFDGTEINHKLRSVFKSQDFLGNLSTWTRGYNTYPFSPPLPDFLPMFRHREEAELAGRGRECLMSMKCTDASSR